MKIAANFMKEVPVEKREIVKRKLAEFVKILPSKRILTDIPKGYWIRRVSGTDIYKFRINSGDRILFRYEQSESIVFLSFQTHDKQIRAAKNISQNIKLNDFRIIEEEYIEDAVDIEINYYARNELNNYLNQILSYEVFDDEYIELAIENNSNELLLSMEQYNCLKEIDNPLMIFGCAGSGKTNIAIRKILLDYQLSKQTIYLTTSEILVQKVKEIIPEGFKEKISILTFKDLLCAELGLEDQIVIEYDDFINWALKDDISELTKGFPLREIWIEINTIIKGNPQQRFMLREEYLSSDESVYPESIKKITYSVASKYDIWLKINNYYDYNDLADMALSRELKRGYENIIFDEVQELTNKQLKYLFKAITNKKTMLLLGDTHQSTQNYHFDLSFIKNELFQEGLILKETFINKNYRSNHGTVDAINKLKQVKQNKFKSKGQFFRQFEIPVRAGIKPYILRGSDITLQNLEELQHDVNLILIVSERREKEQLEAQGIKRVFTIEETRGLEYEKVYTYNILTTFKDVWEKLLTKADKANDLYKTYLNLIYLAMTRSKNSLYMIEDEKTSLEKVLEEYFLYTELAMEDVSTSTKEAWLEEANKLFKLNKYSQAADAYEKAGDKSKQDLCIRLNNHDKLYEVNDQYQSFIVFDLDQCTPKHLKVAMDCLYQKFGVSFKGYFEMRINFKDHSGQRYPSVFIQPYFSNAEVADLLYEQLEEKVLDRKHFICKGTLFLDELPVHLSSIIGGSNEDIKIVIRGNQVRISTELLLAEREKNYFYKKMREIDEVKKEQIYGNYGYNFIEASKEKYSGSSGNEILNYIFSKGSIF